MPRWEKAKDKNGKRIIVEIRSKNTRINMPMTRFRERKGTIAGGDRQGSKVIREGLKNFYRHHGFNPVANGNSLRGFGRDLEPWEVKQVRLGNKARFGNRAGKRALNEDKRKVEYEKTLKSIENGRKKQEAMRRGDGPQRPLPDQEEDVDDYDPPSPRRVNREPEYVPSRSGGNPSRGRGKKAPSSRSQRYGTFGAVPTPHQNPNLNDTYQQPQAPRYNGYLFGGQNPLYPDIGNELAPGLNLPEETYNQSQPSQNPYEFNGNSGMQHGSNQWNREQDLGARRHVPRYELRGSNAYGPGYANYVNGRNNANLLNEIQQQTSVHGWGDGFIGHPTVQNGGMSNTPRPFSSSGYANNYGYGTPARQEPFQGLYGAPEHNENTLGAGGRKAYQVPKQVPEKRRRQDADSGDALGTGRPAPMTPRQRREHGNSTFPDGTQQGQSGARRNPAADEDAPNKRRRHGARGPAPEPEPEPQPQRRRPSGKAPKQQRYGSGGAPRPLPHPTANFPVDAEGPFMPPEQQYGNTPFDADFFADEEGPFLPPDSFSMFEKQWEPIPLSAYQFPPQQYPFQPSSSYENVPGAEGENSTGGQLSTNEGNIYNNGTPQVENAHWTHGQPFINQGSIYNVEAPQVAYGQSLYPQQAPAPAQARQQVPFVNGNAGPAHGQNQGKRWSSWTEEEPEEEL